MPLIQAQLFLYPMEGTHEEKEERRQGKESERRGERETSFQKTWSK